VVDNQPKTAARERMAEHTARAGVTPAVDGADERAESTAVTAAGADAHPASRERAAEARTRRITADTSCTLDAAAVPRRSQW
jgi:hypothetical protein